MEMRVATAMFGHMGLELNLLEEPSEELLVLAEGIRLHKQHRKLFHTGDLYRLDTEDDAKAFGVVSQDKNEAMFSYAFLHSHAMSHPDRIRFDGLAENKNYRVKLIWPIGFKDWMPPSAITELDLTGQGARLSGDALMHNGLQLPNAFPQTTLLYHLVEEI